MSSPRRPRGQDLKKSSVADDYDVDLSGQRERLPRPAGDLSAEAVYKWEDPKPDVTTPKSPSRQKDREREDALNKEKSAGRNFLWPTVDSVVMRPPDAASSSPFPLAVMCSPFADGAGDSTTLPLSDVGGEDPLRCTRCRAYINPYFKWNSKSHKEGKPKLKCNMCDHELAVPPAFAQDMERSGHVADEDTHPELAFGSVDFTTTGAYDVGRQSGRSPPALCFVLEASAAAVRSGFTAAVLQTLRSLVQLAGGEEDPPLVNRRVCLVTFDEAVHFYAQAKSGRFHQVTMNSLEEPYSPAGPSSLFVDLSMEGNSRMAFLQLLEHLEGSLGTAAGGAPGGAFGDDCALAGGPALQAAVEALADAGGGGDVVVFHASSPSCGLGALRPEAEVSAGESSPTASSPTSSPMSPAKISRKRSGVGLPGTPASKSSETGPGGPAAPPRQQALFYEEVLGLCMRAGVCVSCVTTPTGGPMDVSTLQWLPWRTGGDTLHLPYFDASCHGLLLDSLRHWMEKMQASAYDCVVKLRTSKGLWCKSLLAPWPAAASAEDGSAFELTRISPDTSFAFTMYTEPEPDAEEEQISGLGNRIPMTAEDLYYRKDAGRRYLYAQVVVLYSSVKAQRLLRVHTCMITIVTSVRIMYQVVSVAPLVSLLMKQAALLALDKKSGSKVLPRDCLLEFCLQVLTSYLRTCRNGEIRDNELVISRRLQLLPLYILSARKLFYLFQSGTQDSAVCEEFLRRVLRLPVHSLLSLLYPRVYSLPCAAHVGAELPPACRSTKECFAGGRSPAFLVANCLGTWFYMPEPETPEHTPEDKSLDKGVPDRAELWKNAEELSQRIRESLAPGPVWMQLKELPRMPTKSNQDVSNTWEDKIFLASLFVEDEGITEMEYTKWLQFLQNEILKHAA